jgi:hypothetical protein
MPLTHGPIATATGRELDVALEVLWRELRRFLKRRQASAALPCDKSCVPDRKTQESRQPKTTLVAIHRIITCIQRSLGISLIEGLTAWPSPASRMLQSPRTVSPVRAKS